MWAASCHSKQEWGSEKHEGGPRKWEVQRVRHENEVRRKLYFVFTIPSLPHPPTNDIKPCAAATTHFATAATTLPLGDANPAQTTHREHTTTGAPQRHHCDPTKTMRNSPMQQDEPSDGECWETTASGRPGQRPKPTDDELNSTRGNHPAVTKERRRRQWQPGR
jgi:hypothetical protein